MPLEKEDLDTIKGLLAESLQEFQSGIVEMVNGATKRVLGESDGKLGSFKQEFENFRKELKVPTAEEITAQLLSVAADQALDEINAGDKTTTNPNSLDVQAEIRKAVEATKSEFEKQKKSLAAQLKAMEEKQIALQKQDEERQQQLRMTQFSESAKTVIGKIAKDPVKTNRLFRLMQEEGYIAAQEDGYKLVGKDKYTQETVYKDLTEEELGGIIGANYQEYLPPRSGAGLDSKPETPVTQPLRIVPGTSTVDPKAATETLRSAITPETKDPVGALLAAAKQLSA